VSAADKELCPVHNHVFADLEALKRKQGERPCGEHTADLKNLKQEAVGLKKDNDDQWVAINQLRKVVWGWAPIMSFLGSAIGALVVAHFLKR